MSFIDDNRMWNLNLALSMLGLRSSWFNDVHLLYPFTKELQWWEGPFCSVERDYFLFGSEMRDFSPLKKPIYLSFNASWCEPFQELYLKVFESDVHVEITFDFNAYYRNSVNPASHPPTQKNVIHLMLGIRVICFVHFRINWYEGGSTRVVLAELLCDRALTKVDHT